MYKVIKRPGSDVKIIEFFNKLGIVDLWTYIRANILGDNVTFILTILICIIVFILGHKSGSILLQLISSIIGISLIVFQILLM